MKNRSLKLLILSTLFFLILFRDSILYSNPISQTEPDIQFDKRTYDFGKVIQDGKVDMIFKIYNKGQDSLVINKVKTSCGCTAALLTSDVISPRGTGELKATYNSRGAVGKITKKIYVHSNDPDEPEVTLLITGIVDPVLSVRPRYADFEEIPRGMAFTRKLEVYPIESFNDFQILKTEVTSEKISVRFYPVGNTGRYTVEVTLNSNASVGYIAETLKIHSNVPEKPVYNVDIRGNVVSAIKVIPRNLVFKLTKGDVDQKELIVSHYHGNKIQIVELKNSMELASTKIVPVDERNSKIIVNVKAPSDTMGRVQGYLEITTDDTKEPVKKVFVQVELVPEIKVIPNQLTMNLVKYSKNRPFTVSVISHKGNLNINNVKTDLEFLIIENVEEREEGKTFYIRIKPALQAPVGPIHGKILISTDNPRYPVIEVPVDGNVDRSYLE